MDRRNESLAFILAGSILITGMMISLSILYTGGNTKVTESDDSKDKEELVEKPDTNINMDLAEDDPYLGSKSKAQIAIVEFSDYECPFCKKFHTETKDQLISEYVDTNKAIIVWKDLPLPFHEPLATQQAIATQCVNKLAGKENYFKYGNLIFETTESNIGMEESELLELSKQIDGLNQDDFNNCYGNKDTLQKVKDNMKVASEVGVDGTPGFIIGKLENGKIVDGKRVSGALPFETFKSTIDSFLE